MEEIYTLYILDLIFMFLNTSESLNIYADLHSKISDLLLILGVMLKNPRGSERGAFLVHGSDMDLTFYAQIFSRSDM